MKSFVIFTILLITTTMSGQNLLENGDFELSSDCPTGLGQINLLDNWISLIENGDFYDCGFTSLLFESVSESYSGSAYVSYASYGDSTGSSEAIGQVLTEPLYPNEIYTIKLAAKKTIGVEYGEICSGVAIYGFEDPIQISSSFKHITEYDGVQFLGVSEPIENEDWEIFEFQLNPVDEVNYIVFTMLQLPLCKQCIFMDSISLTLDVHISLEAEELASIVVYPNPSQFSILMDLDSREKIEFVEIINQLGQRVLFQKWTTRELDIRFLDPGMYYLRLTDISGNNYTKSIVKSP